MPIHVCTHCGFIYDSFNGDCKNGVPANTDIRSLKDSLCTDCGMMTDRRIVRTVTPYQGKEAELYDQVCGKADISAYMANIQNVDAISVLDVGAGTGRVSIPLAKLGVHVTAIDSSEEMLTKLRNKQNYCNLDFSVINDDILTCELPKEKYTKILLVDGFMQHVSDFNKCKYLLNKLQKALAPNGQIIIEIFIPQQHEWEVTLKKEQTNGTELYFNSKGSLSLPNKKIMTTLQYELFDDHISSYRYRLQRELNLLFLNDLLFMLPNQLEVINVKQFDQSGDDLLFQKEMILPENKILKHWTMGGYPIHNGKPDIVSWWRITIGFKECTKI